MSVSSSMNLSKCAKIISLNSSRHISSLYDVFDICLIAIRPLLGSGLTSPTCKRCFCSKMMLVHVAYDSGRNGSYSVLLKSAVSRSTTQVCTREDYNVGAC